jgi:ATP-dependent Lon protease, bacterial type
MIFAIENLVLLPGMTFPLRVDHLSEDELACIRDKNHEIVALPIKQHQNRHKIKVEDFYTTGVALEVLEVNPSEKGYHVQVRVLNRVEVFDIHIAENMITGKTISVQEVIDLNENGQKEMLTYIKNIAHQIGSLFRESEGIVKAIDKIKDLNVLIGYISRFLPFSKEENIP